VPELKGKVVLWFDYNTAQLHLEMSH